MKHFLLLFSVILISGISLTFAQINIGGEPLSFNSDYKSIIKNDIISVILPKQDNAKLIYEAELNQRKDQPWQFGKNIDIEINIKKQGTLERLNIGELYRLKIVSENALSINLRFSNYVLPEGAVLYIYNESKTHIIGGFTSFNNQIDSVFATGLIYGDQIVIEYFEPNNSKFSGDLKIDRVTHGFRGLSDFTKGLNDSGDCNINVACDDGTWNNEIRSVCMLVTGGSGFCSGALINNTLDDGTPYILTANHCYGNPSSIIYWFNWESETCPNPVISPSHDNISGSVLIAKATDSDFCLLKMSSEPPLSYNVYYSGWNANDVAATSSVGIHHPQGDIKKISHDDNPTFSDFYLGSGGIANSHWKVIWDEGTTEGGSSGSPLFNENHKIIGQLHGGYASCDQQSEPDWYGKFSYSWDMGSTPTSRLKDWLAPYDSDKTEINGYDPNVPLNDYDAQLVAIIEPENLVIGKNKIYPRFLIRNKGNIDLVSLTVNYSLDGGSFKTINWTGNLQFAELDTIEFDPIFLSTGEHSITAFTENPNGFQDENQYNDSLIKDFLVFETIFEDDFENGNFWHLTGEFQIEEPLGLGGEHGFPDPENAYSGTRILGTDLTGLGQHIGDYENNIGFNEEFAISPMIDCRNYENVILSFRRWIGIDANSYDNAKIELYKDDEWISIWQNSNSVTDDNEWKTEVIDISEFADGNKIAIKFTMGPTDHAYQYCGWNIDDFTISGIRNENIISEIDNVLLYPNPAKDYFYIELTEEAATNVYISLSDINGKIVFSNAISENEIKTCKTSTNTKHTIMIKPPIGLFGFFILSITTDSNKTIKKIILM